MSGKPMPTRVRKGGSRTRLEGGGEDDGAGAFGADEGAGDVEAVLGEELVEVEAGDAAGDVGEAGADEVGVAVAESAEAGVDLGLMRPVPAACGGEFGLGGGADGEAGAVVEEDAREAMLSTVLPPMRAWTPQELLPIMPPRVQREWVAGSGAKVRLWSSAASRRRSRTMPGWTRMTVAGNGQSTGMPFMYLEKSRMTATLVHWPASEVPPPRARMGASEAAAERRRWR